MTCTRVSALLKLEPRFCLGTMMTIGLKKASTMERGFQLGEGGNRAETVESCLMSMQTVFEMALSTISPA